MNTDDATLIDAFRRGDEAALSTLLSRHAPGIYRFGLKMCRDPEDAKDVVQDTLFAAARGLREFRGASSMSTWLYTIARSFCIKKRRHHRTRPAERSWVSLDDESVAHVSAQTELPDQATSSRELGRALEAAIAGLAPDYRAALLLRDVEGLHAAEVAEILGVSVEALKSRLHRARAEVRQDLERFASRSGSSLEGSATTCPDIVELFSRYVEDEVGTDECAAMERHIETCARCRSSCYALKATLALCRSSARGDVPFEVRERIRMTMRELASTSGRTVEASRS